MVDWKRFEFYKIGQENDYNLLCINEPYCGCCNSKEDFFLTQRDLIDILIILFFVEIDTLSEYLNMDKEKILANQIH